MAAKKQEEGADYLAALVKSLQEENARLHHEITAGRKVQRVEISKIVAPSDYEQLKRRLSNLTDQVEYYRSVMEHGSLPNIEWLVDKYISESKSQIRKVTKEVSVTNFSKSTGTQIKRLIEYLDSLRSSLRGLVIVQSGGNLMYHPKLRSAQAKAEDIAVKMNSLGTFTEISDVQAEKLLQMLSSMSDFLDEFIAELSDE